MRRDYSFKHPSTYTDEQLMIIGYAAAAEVPHLGATLVAHGHTLADARLVVDAYLEGVASENRRRFIAPQKKETA